MHFTKSPIDEYIIPVVSRTNAKVDQSVENPLLPL